MRVASSELYSSNTGTPSSADHCRLSNAVAAFRLKGLCLASWESCGRLVWRSIEPCDRIAWISSFRRRYDSHQSAAAAGDTVGHPRLLRRDLRERLHDTA